MKACAKSYQTFPDDVAYSPYTGEPLIPVDVWEPGGLEGETLAGYKLERRIYGDVLGEVYRGSKKKRHYAVRVLYPNVTLDDERVDTILSDLERLRTVTHPAVVRVIDASREDGRVFIVSEWVEGRSLRELLEDKTHLEPEQALPILRLVLEGLDALHELDMVHGYLSPDSVFVERAANGKKTVRLLDAGLWRLLHVPDIVEIAEGHPELFSRAADYLAPEIVDGDAPLPASDVYGAAVLTFEMLAGRAPFASPSPAATFKRQQIEDPIPVTLARDTLRLPDGVQDILSLALGKGPDERFETTRACLNALGAVLPPTEAEADGFLPDDAFPRPAPALAPRPMDADTEVDEDDETPPDDDDDDDDVAGETLLGVSPKVVAQVQKQSKDVPAEAGSDDSEDNESDASTESSDKKRKRRKKGKRSRRKNARKRDDSEPNETAAGVGAADDDDEVTASGDPDVSTATDTPAGSKTETGDPATNDTPDDDAPVSPGTRPNDGDDTDTAETGTGEAAATDDDAAAASEVTPDVAIDLDEEDSGDHPLALDDGDWFASGADDISARAFDHEAREYARQSARRTMLVAVLIVVAIVVVGAAWIASSGDDEEEADESTSDVEATADTEALQTAFDSALDLGNLVGPESAYAYLRKLRGALDDATFEPFAGRFLTAARAEIATLRGAALTTQDVPDLDALKRLRDRALELESNLAPEPAPSDPSPPADSGASDGTDAPPADGASAPDTAGTAPPAPAVGRAHRLLMANGAVAGVDTAALGLAPTPNALETAGETWATLAEVHGAMADFVPETERESRRDEAVDASEVAEFFSTLAAGGDAVRPAAGPDGEPATAPEPADDTAPPVDSPAAPDDGATEPTEGTVVPPDETALPSDGTPVPSDGATNAVEGTTTPASDGVAPDAAVVTTPTETTDAPDTPPEDGDAADSSSTSSAPPTEAKPPVATSEPTSKEPEDEPAPSGPSARELTETGYKALKSGDTTAAKSAFDAALDADRGYARAHAGLGEISWDAGRFAEAAKHFGKAVSNARKNASYHIKLGNCHMKLGAWADAASAFENAEKFARDSKTRTIAQKRLEGARKRLGQ